MSALTLAVLPGSGAASESRSLVAGAAAQGMRVTYTVPDAFVVTEFMDSTPSPPWAKRLRPG